MMAKPKLSTAEPQEGEVGGGAAAALLAALGSRPKKSPENSSTISCSKIEPSSKPIKSSKKHSGSISLHSPSLLKTKLTLVDFKLREMAETSAPGESHTLQQIADYVGISRERVRQIEEKALMRLRQKMTQIIKDDKLEIEEFQK